MDTSLLERITIELGKCGRGPCLHGLRIRVKDVMDVLDLLSHGASHTEILDDLPELEEDDIRAALAWAAAQAEHRVVIAA